MKVDNQVAALYSDTGKLFLASTTHCLVQNNQAYYCISSIQVLTSEASYIVNHAGAGCIKK